MEHLNKLLLSIKKDSKLFQSKEVNFIVGLTTTQVKELKKHALLEELIKENKRDFYVTEKGEEYLSKNPIISWLREEFPKRPEINMEALKLEKAPPTMTRAIRQLARHLLENEEIKENSNEHYLIKELLCSNSVCRDIKKEIEDFILCRHSELILGSNPTAKVGEPLKQVQGDNSKKIKLTDLFEKFKISPYGLTKSIIGVLLLDVLNKNKDILAIYENGQFQLKLNQLMFDRMIYCPQNFEVQKTVIEDLPILEDISKIILPCKPSKNILDLTKGLIYFIRNLDKYTLFTERLNKKTIRFRNAILNAKDPISLFYRDIPKILEDKILCQCDKEFLIDFDKSIVELKESYLNLVNEINSFLLEAFRETSREKLSKRFNEVKDYLNENDLKILYNNIKNTETNNQQWIERIATFINKSRVPKDWSDNDVADFKVKVKELALKFLAIEATAGAIEVELDNSMTELLNQLLDLEKPQRMTILRRVING